MTTSDASAQLLKRYLPIMRYDSKERFFADCAAMWTHCPGNRLVLASGEPAVSGSALTLSYLGPKYPTGEQAVPGDRIEHPGHNYAADAAEMRADAGYADWCYGHAACSISDGCLWLQYWFFYFYNAFSIAGIADAGDHEGDWEMIQLRLGEDQVPTLAVYAQHKHAEQRPWARVEKVMERPVVYPALGDHASYFTADTHWTGAWFDIADGRGPSPELKLHVITDKDRWVHWPGYWGGTVPSADDENPLDDASPRGPGRHAQYHDPGILLAKTLPRELKQ